jgi:hypothetical protein
MQISTPWLRSLRHSAALNNNLQTQGFNHRNAVPQSPESANQDLFFGARNDLKRSLSQSFANNRHMDAVVRKVTELLPDLTPPLKSPSPESPARSGIVQKPNSLTVQNRGTALRVDKSGHIQVYRNGQPLFIPLKDLDSATSIDSASKRIIGGGGRFLDPWNQDDWSTPWPPDEKTTLGPVKTTAQTRNDFNAVMIEPGSEAVGKLNGAIPRGMVALRGNSVLMAFQIENISPRQMDQKWGSWFVGPMAVPAGGTATDPQALTLFPVSNKSIQTLDLPHEPTVLPRRWELQSDRMVLNQTAWQTGDPDKVLLSDTNWVMLARKGSDEVVLMRSHGAHDDHFQVYAGQPGYSEWEFTGPRVPSGKKSTLAVRLDFISLKDLGVQFNRFGEAASLAEDANAVFDRLKQHVNATNRR